MNDIRYKLQSIVLENNMSNDFLYNYIMINNIKHTTNQNGIFVNLSKLNDDVINDMYEYKNKMSINSNKRKETNDIIKNKSYTKKEIIQKTYKSLPVFNKLQNEILMMSKTI